MILRPRRNPSGVRVMPLSAARCCKVSRCLLDPVARSRLTLKRRASVSQIDRHLAGGDYLGWAREPFDLRDQSQVRNKLAAAAEVAGGDGADQAGHGTPPP